ncbi:SGNH/GDSL hydrolase family protein [Teratosphaeria destructans]|uniref:SGNH/GDSL hydrolase family protein n=1 Tax=Teratosphaeria destructans TaxID=418781 RepID=A0A9W7SJP9_9PEZI|nr:SGNH/GDSL hydrolase family protein [Teratosphaeria destructans]
MECFKKGKAPSLSTPADFAGCTKAMLSMGPTTFTARGAVNLGLMLMAIGLSYPTPAATLEYDDQLSTSDGGPLLIGRFDTTDPSGPRFAWSGSSIFARFTGTDISYDVVIDGGEPTLLKPHLGRGTYVLADGLTGSSHTVMLTKRTEALVGTAQFLGFAVQGKSLAAPQISVKKRRIEIIGDSITCGYGVLGADGSCHFSPSTENVAQAYGYLAAQKLDAEVHVNCWSGKGVYRNNDKSTTNTMLDLWQLSLPADHKTAWDFSIWQPQVVVINLSTNDFAGGVPDALAFQGAYQKLLAQVRGKYPDALIFCALGPLMSDTYPAGQKALSTARKDIQSALKSANDDKVFFVEFPPQGADVGCDYHPNVATQAAMAEQLAEAIGAKTGWHK